MLWTSSRLQCLFETFRVLQYLLLEKIVSNFFLMKHVQNLKKKKKKHVDSYHSEPVYILFKIMINLLRLF